MGFNLSSLIGGMHDDEEVFNISRVDLSTDNIKPNTGSAIKENTAQQNEQKENNINSSTTNQGQSGEFDPNVMFNIGVRNVSGNPFSKEELNELSTELDKRSDPSNAQTLNIETFEPTPRAQSFETNIDESSTIVVGGEDGKDFELVGASSLTESTILQPQEGELEISIGDNESSVNMFDAIGKDAEKVDSAEYAEKFNPNAVVTNESTGDDSNDIIIDVAEPINVTNIESDGEVITITDTDDSEIQVLDCTVDEQKEIDYIAQMDKIQGTSNNSVPSQEQYYDNAIPPQEDEYAQGNNSQPVVNKPSSSHKVVENTGDKFLTYETELGEKYRVRSSSLTEPTFETTNPYIMDFESLPFGEIESEVLVKDVKIIPYGSTGQTRIEWTVATKNLIEHKFSQFNLSDTILKSELEPFVGNTASITGKVSTRNNAKNLVVNLIGLAKHTTPADFGVGITPQKSNVDQELEMYKDWYRTLTGNIRTPWLRTLLKECLENTGHLGRMLQSSAGTKVHDSAVSGLFKHTMKVTMNAHLVAKNYPFVNYDVVIVSALLHDIGKIFEMEDGKYTQMGELTGHIIIGQTIVSNTIQALKNNGVEVNENESANVIHCILAHHGKLEWGSPVKPKTPEAMLLHLVDMIDANLTHMDETLADKSKAYSKTFGTSMFNLN